MRCACMHTFIVMEGAPMCLIGGDILQRFKACHLLRDREYHLYPTEGDLEVVHVDDPDMCPEKHASSDFIALRWLHTGRPPGSPDARPGHFPSNPFWHPNLPCTAALR